MPNHVTQQLTVIAAEAPEIIRFVAGGDSAVDFHKVIPLPEELNIEETSEGSIGLAAITGKCEWYLTFPWVEKLGIQTPDEFKAYVERDCPDSIELARMYIANRQKYGHPTWRQWCHANWGTKWNAYSVGEWESFPDRLTIHFKTANSPAIPVIARISEHFAEIGCELRYFDEDWSLAGEAFFDAGRCVDKRFTPKKKDLRTRLVHKEVYGFDFA